MSPSKVDRERLLGCLGCQSSSDSDVPLLEENGFTGYQCKDCQLIYISPRPNAEDVIDLYGHDSAHVSAQELINASRSHGKSLKARLTLRVLRKYRPDGELLEIGAGGGRFLREAVTCGYRVFAAEFNPTQVRHMRSLGIECRQGAFAEVFEGMKFDVIYHCDVLSHFFDPVAEFKAMHKMLKPGGVVIFETGNFGDISTRYHGLVDRWQYPDHLYFFSENSLRNLAAASGFRIEMTRGYARTIEMLLDRVAMPVKKLLKKDSSRVGSGENRSRSSGRSGRSFIALAAMNVKHLIDFFLVYVVGRVLPKRGRPQTVIAVFRRPVE